MAVQFGASMFEGIRCYETPDGPAIFRLKEHIRRLHDSCRIYRMPLAHSADALVEACRETVRKNGLSDCYIRPMVLWGYGVRRHEPGGHAPGDLRGAWPWGAYLGEEALAKGVDVCVSSWQRAHPNTFPVQAKAAGHYVNAQLIKMEAVANGYVEGIALSPSGLVSEGSGQNLFLVRDGVGDHALPGRDVPGGHHPRRGAGHRRRSGVRGARAGRAPGRASTPPTRCSSRARPPR